VDKWSFGLTLLVVGVAGTFLTLWILAIAVNLLKRAFPLPPEEKQ
jgi:hypothetical protein